MTLVSEPEEVQADVRRIPLTSDSFPLQQSFPHFSKRAKISILARLPHFPAFVSIPKRILIKPPVDREFHPLGSVLTSGMIRATDFEVSQKGQSY